MSADKHILECERLVAGYTKPVTSEISLKIGAGDVLGLRGGNGVGKSTLLRSIAGAARVFTGVIRKMPGTELLHHQQQWEAGIELPLTGLDLCRLTGASAAVVPDRLKPIMKQRFDRLSGGQTQLVRLWACMGSSANLLLLDEPTNNLDIAALDTLTTMIRQGSANRAIIVVSHDAAFLDSICTGSIHMESA